MRLATWNVNSVGARLPRLLDWLEHTAPDVVCLQETKCAAEAFPAAEVAELGYATAAHGDGRWNGVAVLSRVGLSDVVRGLPGEPGYPDAGTRESRAVGATCGPLRVWSVYVPNGREVAHPHFEYKLEWLSVLRDVVVRELGAGLGTAAAFAVCGDYNVAPADDDLYSPAAFVGSTHVTPAEREALARLREAGLSDVVPRPGKGDRPFTYWDYRAGMFHKDLGMRIDLVYGDAALAAAVQDAYVDREARKGKGPSDHAPVVVDLDLEAAPVPPPAVPAREEQLDLLGGDGGRAG